MKITSLVAATAAVLVTLGACSAAPAGIDSPSSMPSLELSNTLSTTTFLQPAFSCLEPAPAPAAADTAATSIDTTTVTPTTTSEPQLSASGTYAVAHGGTTIFPVCVITP